MKKKRGELFGKNKKRIETNGRNWENIIYGGKDGNFLELLF